MSEAPEPPADPDVTDEEEPPELVPFYTVSAGGNATVVARAGWQTPDGQIYSLAVDVTVDVRRASAAGELALAWYLDQLAAAAEAAEEREASADA